MVSEHCEIHPDREALSFCHSCKRYLCKECLVEGSEYYYCSDEACQEAWKEEVEPERTRTAAASPTSEMDREMSRFVKLYWIVFWLNQAVAIILGIEQVVVLGMGQGIVVLVNFLVGVALAWAFVSAMLHGLRRFSTAWRRVCTTLCVVGSAFGVIMTWGAWHYLIALIWPIYIIWFLALNPRVKAEFRRVRKKRQEILAA